MNTNHADQETYLGFLHPRRVVRVAGIEPGMKIAEFGAGPGELVRACAEVVGEHGRVYAIDVQQDLLKKVSREMTQAGLKNVEVVWANIEEPHGTKLADNSVDIVTMSNVLFQCDNKHAALTEARRVLHPGGMIVLVDWTDSFGGMGPQKSDIVTSRMARQLLEDAGFSVVREFEPGAHHYGLLARASSRVAVQSGIQGNTQT